MLFEGWNQLWNGNETHCNSECLTVVHPNQNEIDRKLEVLKTLGRAIRKMTEIISVISLFKRNCQVESNKVEQKYLDTSCIHLILLHPNSKPLSFVFKLTLTLLRQLPTKFH